MNMEALIHVRKGREDDWEQIRDCFVRSFHNYPLYEYIVQVEEKRDEFMIRYLDANYQAYKRMGNGVLIAVTLRCNNTQRDKNNYKIIGGAFFSSVLKSDQTQNEEDQVIDEMYGKFQLREFDEDAYQRLLSYERWESKNVETKLRSISSPTWNGLFSAIDLQYCQKGIGSYSYTLIMKELLKIVNEKLNLSVTTHHNPILHHLENESNVKMCKSVCARSTPGGLTKEILNKKILGQKSNIFFWRFHLFVKNALYIAFNALKFKILCVPTRKCNEDTDNIKGKEVNLFYHSTKRSFTVIAITHNPRALVFHKRNGLKEIYSGDFLGTDDKKQFPVHVLALNMSI